MLERREQGAPWNPMQGRSRPAAPRGCIASTDVVTWVNNYLSTSIHPASARQGSYPFIGLDSACIITSVFISGSWLVKSLRLQHSCCRWWLLLHQSMSHYSYRNSQQADTTPGKCSRLLATALPLPTPAESGLSIPPPTTLSLKEPPPPPGSSSTSRAATSPTFLSIAMCPRSSGLAAPTPAFCT
jgi:hypothetical protein